MEIHRIKLQFFKPLKSVNHPHYLNFIIEFCFIFSAEILKIWCKKTNVKIRDLLLALEKMERHDVKHELEEQILKDCQGLRNYNSSENDERELATRGDLLTVQVR